jgi:hypothetical protein
MATRLNESQIRNYNQWPIIGTYVWPNYFIGNSYQAEVDTLKWWIKQRFEWLDANIPGNLIGCGFTNVNELDSQFNFEIYPNPFQNQFTVQFNEKVQGTAEIKIMNLIGEEVFYVVSNTFEGKIKIELSESLPAGVYFVEVKADGRNSNLKKLLKE